MVGSSKMLIVLMMRKTGLAFVKTDILDAAAVDTDTNIHAGANADDKSASARELVIVASANAEVLVAAAAELSAKLSMHLSSMVH